MRRREDDAPRLRSAVRQLRSLRLRFASEASSNGGDSARYTKPVVVATAPAHFEIHCLEPRCDGYHDITSTVMAGLGAERGAFSGSSECHGTLGTMPCGRVLVFSAEATYGPGPS